MDFTNTILARHSYTYMCVYLWPRANTMGIIATIERHPRPAHTHRSNARIPQDYGNSACLLMWEFGDANYRNYDHHYCHDDYYMPSVITSTVASVAVIAAAVAVLCFNSGCGCSGNSAIPCDHMSPTREPAPRTLRAHPAHTPRIPSGCFRSRWGIPLCLFIDFDQNPNKHLTNLVVQ